MTELESETIRFTWLVQQGSARRCLVDRPRLPVVLNLRCFSGGLGEYPLKTTKLGRTSAYLRPKVIRQLLRTPF